MFSSGVQLKRRFRSNTKVWILGTEHEANRWQIFASLIFVVIFTVLKLQKLCFLTNIHTCMETNILTTATEHFGKFNFMQISNDMIRWQPVRAETIKFLFLIHNKSQMWNIASTPLSYKTVCKLCWMLYSTY